MYMIIVVDFDKSLSYRQVECNTWNYVLHAFLMQNLNFKVEHNREIKTILINGGVYLMEFIDGLIKEKEEEE